MTLESGGREIILDMSLRYGAISYIRAMIANFCDQNTYQISMIGLTRNLDSKHWLLFQDLLTIMRSPYGIDIIEELFKEMVNNGYVAKQSV